MHGPNVLKNTTLKTEWWVGYQSFIFPNKAAILPMDTGEKEFKMDGLKKLSERTG